MLKIKKLISIVVPVFNEGECIEETIRRLLKLQACLLSVVDIEMIFVDDGSMDNSISLLRTASFDHPSIKVILFTRNFGHQIAITAGIDAALGDYVAIIDADLQDPPELIADMYRLGLSGVDVIYGQRRSRAGETVFKKISATVFYKFINYMCDIEIPRDTGDFRLMSRRAVDAFKLLRERHRFIRGMIPWVGFKSAPLEYDRAERFAGKTKYPIRRMVAFATNAVLSFSSKPLTMATRLGLFTILAGCVGGGYMLYLKIFTNIPVPGLTAILLTIVLFGGCKYF